jgi:hypothetical protein
LVTLCRRPTTVLFRVDQPLAQHRSLLNWKRAHGIAGAPGSHTDMIKQYSPHCRCLSKIAMNSRNKAFAQVHFLRFHSFLRYNQVVQAAECMASQMALSERIGSQWQANSTQLGILLSYSTAN